MAYDSNVHRLLADVIENLQSNQTACTKINVLPWQLNEATPEEKLVFCKSLAENKYVIYLDLSKNLLDAEFTSFFISALEKNHSITTLYYDKQSLTQETIISIQKIIERNRQWALEREINPKLIPLEELLEWQQTFAAANGAAESGDLDLLFTLLTQNPAWASRLMSPILDFLSLLHTAAEHGQIDCVKLLIKLGADVNAYPLGARNIANGTPLHKAVDSNFFVIAQLLIHNGADISGNSVLHSMFLNSTLDLELLDLLIKNGANVRDVNTAGDTVLHQLIRSSPHSTQEFITALNLLIQAGADPTILNNAKYSPLALAKHIKSKFTSSIEEATNDYVEIRKNAWLVSIGRKKSIDNRSLFKTLPDELNMRILLANPSRILDEKSLYKIVEQNFLPDYPNDNDEELDDNNQIRHSISYV